MKKLLLRIIPDVKETIYRDIEIGSKQSLLELHKIILKAFELSGDQMASFFETDEFWEQKQEIPMIRISDEENKLMEDYAISDLLKNQDEKLLYVYDFLLFRQFFIELMSIEEVDQVKNLPRVVKRFGETPKVSQKQGNAEDAESILLEALLGEDFKKDVEGLGAEDEGEDEWDDYDEEEYDDRY